MDQRQAKSLNVGDRVIWNDSDRDSGKVTAQNEFAVTIEWENGVRGTIDHRDMQSVSRGR